MCSLNLLATGGTNLQEDCSCGLLNEHVLAIVSMVSASVSTRGSERVLTILFDPGTVPAAANSFLKLGVMSVAVRKPGFWYPLHRPRQTRGCRIKNLVLVKKPWFCPKGVAHGIQFIIHYHDIILESLFWISNYSELSQTTVHQWTSTATDETNNAIINDSGVATGVIKTSTDCLFFNLIFLMIFYHLVSLLLVAP